MDHHGDRSGREHKPLARVIQDAALSAFRTYLSKVPYTRMSNSAQ
jgi:hypothetical protein